MTEYVYKVFDTKTKTYWKSRKGKTKWSRAGDAKNAWNMWNEPRFTQQHRFVVHKFRLTLEWSLKVLTVDQLSLKQLVPVFLMASWLYYIHDISPMEDTEYDLLCNRMLEHWDDIEHPHKYLITKDDLKAGSGYAINSALYPRIATSSAIHWAKQKGLWK